MVMLMARNIESLLNQGLQPVPTTSKSVYALTITQATGTPLSTVRLEGSTDCNLTKVKMYALYVARSGISEDVTKAEIEDMDVYSCLVPDTHFGVVAVCERDYPEGLIRMRLRNLAANLTDLKKFEEDDEGYGDGY